MPAAIRSLFTASVAVASAGVIAVSPLAPAPAVPIPTVQIPGIELVNGASVPALGAIPYQILVNLVGDALALAPIVIGGIQQCAVCVGPVPTGFSPAASPFTGWGALGVGVGLLTSPFAIIGAVQAGQSILQALGVGLLAIQTPIINTATLIQAPRQPFGGYEFQATRARAAQAVVEAVVGAFGVTREVLTGVRTIIAGSLAGVTVFAQTLATTGDVVAAFNAGLAPFTAGIQTALGNTVGAIQTLRTAVYAELTRGPRAATSPIPIVSAASAAAAASTASAAPAASADMPRTVAVARATGTAAPVAASGNDSPSDDSPGDESPAARAVSGDSGRAAAKPSRARSAEARSTDTRSTGTRSTGARASGARASG